MFLSEILKKWCHEWNWAIICNASILLFVKVPVVMSGLEPSVQTKRFCWMVSQSILEVPFVILSLPSLCLSTLSHQLLHTVDPLHGVQFFTSSPWMTSQHIEEVEPLVQNQTDTSSFSVTKSGLHLLYLNVR